MHPLKSFSKHWYVPNLTSFSSYFLAGETPGSILSAPSLQNVMSLRQCRLSIFNGAQETWIRPLLDFFEQNARIRLLKNWPWIFSLPLDTKRILSRLMPIYSITSRESTSLCYRTWWNCASTSQRDYRELADLRRLKRPYLDSVALWKHSNSQMS